jgi:tRNA dimethylallyltransferase
LGPTGVGKSRTAVKLAHIFKGEVISCDSMQVYRGFDIGTDKLPEAEREGIPHHLLDIWDPSLQFTAADFVRLALETIAAIQAHDHLPIITGGTGLYLKALIEGLFPEGKKNPGLRRELEAQLNKEGLESLWNQLQEADPGYAQKIGPHDRVRILRALEVFLATGKPFSHHFPETRSFVADYNLIRIGLQLERQVLYRRIEERVDHMFAQGMVQEVEKLLVTGVEETAPPFRALGYQQVLRYLHDEIDLNEAVRLTKQETRHYAKRQMTWFRKMQDILWFTPQDLDEIAEYIRLRTA